MANAKTLFNRRSMRTRARLQRLASDRPRLSVFRSGKHIYAQVIDDKTGTTLAAASSIEADVRAVDGDKKAHSTRVGQLIAERAKAAGIEEVVFDRGGYTYGGRIAALADAATLPSGTRDAFARIAELKRTVERRQDDLDRIEGERARLLEEQARLRENLQAVPPETDLHRRYLASLDRQEDQLEALAERRAAADLALREARTALSDYLSGLEL